MRRDLGPKYVYTYWFIRIPYEFMGFKNKHIHEGCFAMVEMPDYGNISYHVREGRHIQKKTVEDI